MLSHVTLGVSNIPAAMAFYDAALAPLGIIRRYTFDDSLGYALAGGPEDGPAQLWVMHPFNGQPPHAGNGWHVALVAPSRAAVDAFHAAALAHGGISEGAPGVRPLYHPEYYAAYVRDPEGNKLQAVNHGSQHNVI